MYAGTRVRGMQGGLVPFVQQYIIPASITSYRAGWMAFTIRGILCATHTWPHIPRHGRRYLHPAETRPQNRRENMLQDFSRECRRSRSLSVTRRLSRCHRRIRSHYRLKNGSPL